jgi:hypothetical protein
LGGLGFSRNNETRKNRVMVLTSLFLLQKPYMSGMIERIEMSCRRVNRVPKNIELVPGNRTRILFKLEIYQLPRTGILV